MGNHDQPLQLGMPNFSCPDYGNKIRAKFSGSCLKDKITYCYGKIVYIVYEIIRNFSVSSYPALKIVWCS